MVIESESANEDNVVRQKSHRFDLTSIRIKLRQRDPGHRWSLRFGDKVRNSPYPSEIDMNRKPSRESSVDH